MAVNRNPPGALLGTPFVLALYLFGFLLEFILELPFLIAFFLTRRAAGKAAESRVRIDGV